MCRRKLHSNRCDRVLVGRHLGAAAKKGPGFRKQRKLSSQMKQERIEKRSKRGRKGTQFQKGGGSKSSERESKRRKGESEREGKEQKAKCRL